MVLIFLVENLWFVYISVCYAMCVHTKHCELYVFFFFIYSLVWSSLHSIKYRKTFLSLSHLFAWLILIACWEQAMSIPQHTKAYNISCKHSIYNVYSATLCPIQCLHHSSPNHDACSIYQMMDSLLFFNTIQCVIK